MAHAQPGAETPTDPLEPTSGCISSSAGGAEACELHAEQARQHASNAALIPQPPGPLISPALGTEQSAASCGKAISAHARSPAEGDGEAGGGGSGARDGSRPPSLTGLPQHAPLPPQPPAMQLFFSRWTLSKRNVPLLYHSSGSARFPTRLWGRRCQAVHSGPNVLFRTETA